jgi:hypothetical protein
LISIDKADNSLSWGHQCLSVSRTPFSFSL